MESKGPDDTFAHAQDDLYLRVLRMLENPFSLNAAKTIKLMKGGPAKIIKLLRRGPAKIIKLLRTVPVKNIKLLRRVRFT